MEKVMKLATMGLLQLTKISLLTCRLHKPLRLCKLPSRLLRYDLLSKGPFVFNKCNLSFTLFRKKTSPSLKVVLNRKQNTINFLRRELNKHIRAQNILFEKYHHLDKSTSVLMKFKIKKAVPLLRHARLLEEKVNKENRELTTLFWMLMEERDILVNFLYLIYCRHCMIDFSYLGEYSGGLLSRLHKRYLDEFGSDPHPGQCWNLSRVHLRPRDLPPDKLNYYKDKFISEFFEKSILYEPDN